MTELQGNVIPVEPSDDALHFEIYICGGCGESQWFAADAAAGPPGSDLPSGRLRGLPGWTEELGRCPACEGATRRVQPMADMWKDQGQLRMSPMAVGVREVKRVGPTVYEAVGKLGGLLCCDCGFVEWRASDLADVATLQERVPPAPACPRCPTPARLVSSSPDRSSRWVDPQGFLEEEWLDTRVVARWWESFHIVSAGLLCQRVCPGCGHVEWLCQLVDQLEHRPASGLYCLDTSAHPVDDGARGPYR